MRLRFNVFFFQITDVWLYLVVVIQYNAKLEFLNTSTFSVQDYASPKKTLCTKI